ncbi:MAG: efflux RND transporter periplasmic adaptor subunit [Steroidobacteraceae bacterium]
MSRLQCVVIAPLALAVVLLAGCTSGKSPATADEAKPAPYPVLTAQLRPVPVERQLDGRIEAVNQGTVSAETSGRVVEINYDVNDFVPAGAVILRLRATEQRAGLLQAQAALREATARQGEANSRYERVADMYERKVVPKAMFDEALANRDAADARLAAARASVQSASEGLGYTEVRAPYAGVVVKRHVEIGESVSPGTPLVSGLSLQFLRVAVDIPQRLVEQVRKIRKAAVYAQGKRIDATQVVIFPQAQQPSATFRARVDLPENAADLYPGMLVKVGFVVGEAESLTLPASAVMHRSEVTGVYVWDPAAGVTRFRQLRIGQSVAEAVEVLAGLRAGEQVAVDAMSAMSRATADAAESRQ